MNGVTSFGILSKDFGVFPLRRKITKQVHDTSLYNYVWYRDGEREIFIFFPIILELKRHSNKLVVDLGNTT